MSQFWKDIVMILLGFASLIGAYFSFKSAFKTPNQKEKIHEALRRPTFKKFGPSYFIFIGIFLLLLGLTIVFKFGHFQPF